MGKGDEAILECAFFIPVRRDAHLSDGKKHKPILWKWLDSELYRQFEGGSQASGLYRGFYKDPDTGERVEDESRRFLLAVPQSRLIELRSFISGLCLLFQQKAIYLSIGGIVEFIEAPPHEQE